MLLHRRYAALTHLPLRPDQGAGGGGGAPDSQCDRASAGHGVRHVAAGRRDLLVNHFVYVAVTDGYLVMFEKDFKCNFIHIRDVADCFIHCIENSEQMAGLLSPICFHQLAVAGIRRVVLCVGHLGEQVESAIGERHGSLQVRYSWEFVPLARRWC